MSKRVFSVFVCGLPYLFFNQFDALFYFMFPVNSLYKYTKSVCIPLTMPKGPILIGVCN